MCKHFGPVWVWRSKYLLLLLLIPCRKCRSPYVGKATAALHLPVSVCIIIHLPIRVCVIIIHLPISVCIIIIHLPISVWIIIIHLPVSVCIIIIQLSISMWVIIIHLPVGVCIIIIHLPISVCIIIIHLPISVCIIIIHLPISVCMIYWVNPKLFSVHYNWSFWNWKLLLLLQVLTIWTSAMWFLESASSSSSLMTRLSRL